MRKSLLIHPGELSRKWVDRAAGLGIQALALHPEGGKAAHESLERMLEMLETAEYRALLDEAAARGLEIEYEFHAASWLLPREYFSEHPGWFRMNEDGERTPEMNFCVSDPEALETVCERAVQLTARLYRSAPRYHFWLDDDRSARCFCPKCRAMSASDQQLSVMNAILTAIRKHIPAATLSYLAYFETITPPEAVKPVPGVFLEYAPFDRDMKLPADTVAESEKANMRALLRFFGEENAQVLEYWYDNSMFSGWKKPPQPFTVNNGNVRADLRFYRELGFADISGFACFLGEDYEALYGEPDLTAFGE